MKRAWFFVLALLAVPAAARDAGKPPEPKARNIILFVADGAGVTSLSAASIFGYNRPNALYVQAMPYLGLADTSTASGWIPDSGASATAMATGVKTNNYIVGETPDAVVDVSDGTALKTVMEYAQEHGLATGIISNDDPQGITNGIVSAFYAHSNNRLASGKIFAQLLAPRYGSGIDVVIGTGRAQVIAKQQSDDPALTAAITARGYRYVRSLDQLAALPTEVGRVMMLTDDPDFSIEAATSQAITRLSRNPRGYFLVVFTNSHLSDARKNLQRIVEVDRAVRASEEGHEQDTLSIFTADHGFHLLMQGEHLAENRRTDKGEDVLRLVSLEDQHTGEAVPVLARGPGAQRVHGFMSNTDLFDVTMSAFGWSH